MERTPHCLVVEDDREISDLLARFLVKHGFRVSVAPNGRAMDRILGESRIDIMVLDIMLPNEDGLSLCRRVRSESNVPIIMLTALGDEMDRIVGLEMGADDYVAKPFNSRELLARLRAVLRRVQSLPESVQAAKSSTLTFDGWRVDLALRQLHAPDGARVVLTSGEFDLLVAFCQHPHRVLTRDQLLDLTLGRSAKAFDRSVDIRISRLRRKIEPDPKQPTFITTVRSGGYFFAAQVAVT
jgi:two-component system OmpR family response regulator